jgi:hypothetical protein
MTAIRTTRKAAILECCRGLKIEPPIPDQLERLVRAAIYDWLMTVSRAITSVVGEEGGALLWVVPAFVVELRR